MKIYLGGPMFDLPNVRYNLDFSNRIRSIGYEVYCPNENLSINDKSRSDITPERVYSADVDELMSSNIFLCQVAEDSGTMWEAGFMDCLARHVDPARYRGVIGLATDIRLATLPDPKKIGSDNQAWALNAFISGGLKSSLGLYLKECDLFARLGQLLGGSR
ncbi:nucleoside 2-deoxyribosyltransferase [Rhizobium daejeonense]